MTPMTYKSSEPRRGGGKPRSASDSRRRPPSPLHTRPDRVPGPPVIVDEYLESIDPQVLPRAIRRDLATLPDHIREPLEKLLAASRLTIEDDPERAMEYARKARAKAPRLAVVREAFGVAAYRNGDFKTARAQLLAARRMAGRDDLLPLLADCERGLGKPEQALKLATDPGAKTLQGHDAIELLLVVAGARADMGQRDTAALLLERPARLAKQSQPWSARLCYAYADLLAQLDRNSEALEWFTKAANWDAETETDAAERIDALGGVEFAEPVRNDDEEEVAEVAESEDRT